MTATIDDGTEKTIDEMEELVKKNGEIGFVDKDGERLYNNTVSDYTIKDMRPSVIKWSSETYNDFNSFQRRRSRQRMHDICVATLALLTITIFIVTLITALYIGWAIDNPHLFYLFGVLTAISPMATILYVRHNYTINGNIID